MEWSDEYSVGIEEIDSQHRRLVKLFSMVGASIERNRSSCEDGLDWIETLKGVAESHMEFEEALMRLYDYQEIVEHQQAHRLFIRKMAVILKTTPNEPAVVAVLTGYLSEWLKGHVRGADARFAQFILSGAAVVRSTPPN